MKKSIQLSLLFILYAMGVSCGILGTSEDECSCTEITWHTDASGTRYSSNVHEIPCNDKLNALSEKGKTKFRWFLEDGLLQKVEAINCSGADEPRIVDCGTVEYKGQKFNISCRSGTGSFRVEVSRTIGNKTISACFLLTCSPTTIPFDGGGQTTKTCLETVRLCN